MPEAIENYCELIRTNDTLKTNIQAYGQFEKLPADFTLLTYRVVQELIQNIVKHAQASHLIVQLLVNDSLISITVEDNGRGFMEAQQGNGMGLQSIRSLIKTVKGIFSVQSSPENGTSVYIEIPLENYIPEKII